jgi:hypothetical protein
MLYKKYTARILQFLGFSDDEYDVVTNLANNGAAKISSWTSQQPQPSEEELLAAWNEMTSEPVVLKKQKASKIDSLKQDIHQAIIDKYSIPTQLNIFNLMEGYSQQQLDEMKVFINEQRKKQQELEKKISECTTLEELSKVVI